MNCRRRQRVVKKGPEGIVESFRCLNRQCDLHGQPVSQAICDGCPLKELKHVKPCAKKAPKHPRIAAMIVSWKESIKKWRAAGKPKRSDEEVHEILETKCKQCGWYDADKRRCKGCGCKVTRGGIAVFNKIRMATEHCPRDLW